MKRNLTIFIIFMAFLILLPACVPDAEVSDAVSSKAEESSTASAEISDAVSEDASSEESNRSEISDDVSDETSEENSDEVSEESSESSEDTSSEEISDPPQNEESNPGQTTAPYLINGLIVDGTRVMTQFGATSKSGIAYATEYMNPFKEYLGDKVNLYTTVFPLASAFYAPKEYPLSLTAHPDAMDVIGENLVDATYIDTLAAMRKHADEDLYFRTDHHWNALGAYYAAQEMARVMGVPFAELNDDNFTTYTNEGMCGSYFNYTKVDGKYLKVLVDNPDTFTWYETKANYDIEYYTTDYSSMYGMKSLYININSYMKFICGDDKCVEITTDCDNGRVLWLIKDSYGNAIPQYFVSSFSKIYVADIRYCPLPANRYIEEHGITDVCVALSATSAFSGNARCIRSFMQ